MHCKILLYPGQYHPSSSGKLFQLRLRFELEVAETIQLLENRCCLEKSALLTGTRGVPISDVGKSGYSRGCTSPTTTNCGTSNSGDGIRSTGLMSSSCSEWNGFSLSSISLPGACESAKGSSEVVSLLILAIRALRVEIDLFLTMSLAVRAIAVQVTGC